jgi:hypothetical protein
MERTRTPQYTVLAWMCIANTFFASFVIISSMAVDGARVIYAPTMVAELSLCFTMIKWITMLKHRITTEVDVAIWQLIFTTVFMFIGAVVALEEVHTCFFEAHDTFASISACSDLLAGGRLSSLSTSSQVCENVITSNGRIGSCAAAQVSSGFIETARVLGVMLGITIVLQSILCIFILCIYQWQCSTAMNNARDAENETRERSLLLASSPAQRDKLKRAWSDIGKCTPESVEAVVAELYPISQQWQKATTQR